MLVLLVLDVELGVGKAGVQLIDVLGLSQHVLDRQQVECLQKVCEVHVVAGVEL